MKANKKTERQVCEMSEAEYLSSGEFAKAIGVSHSTVKRWHNTGILKASIVTPTGIRKYTMSQVQDYFRKYHVKECDSNEV